MGKQGRGESDRTQGRDRLLRSRHLSEAQRERRTGRSCARGRLPPLDLRRARVLLFQRPGRAVRAVGAGRKVGARESRRPPGEVGGQAGGLGGKQAAGSRPEEQG